NNKATQDGAKTYFQTVKFDLPSSQKMVYMENCLTKILSAALLSAAFSSATAQVTTTNNLFSFGSYGRVGVGFSPAIEGNIGRSFNLNGMGSIGGRMEEADYVELIGALHFNPVNHNSDTTSINVKARAAMYSSNGQLIGNVSSTSYG